MIARLIEGFRESVWFVRCALAAEAARLAKLLGERAYRQVSQGRSAWCSRPAAIACTFTARMLMPRVLRDKIDELTAHVHGK